MVQVNPEVNKDGYQFNPVGRVTGLFVEPEAVTAAVEALRAAGVPNDRLEVFTGEEGKRRIDASGEAHGAAGRLFRMVESWVSDTSSFHALAERHLAAGGHVVAAEVGDDEALKSRAMQALSVAGATDVKYWHTLFVEEDNGSTR